MKELLKEIVNGEFINIVYNDELYLLVDEFNYKNKIVTYFNSLKGDLFCYKRGSSYEVIKDEKIIQKLRDDNDLYVEDYMYLNKFKSGRFESKEIDNGYKSYLLENFINSLFDVSNIDKREVLNIIRDVKIKETNKLNAFHIPSKTVYIKKGNFKDKVVFHELLHALGYIKNKKSFLLLGSGLNEGIVSLLTAKSFSKNISSIHNSNEYNFDTHFMSFCPECAAIANQIEFINGEDIINFLVGNVDKEIEKFCSKSSLNTFLKIRYKTKKMYKNFKKDKDNSKEVLETQDIILRNVFDKLSNRVETREDAISVLEALNEFGRYRVRSNGKDKTLEKYFETKKEEFNKKLGLNLDARYNRVQFNTRYLTNEYDKRIYNDMKSYLNLNAKGVKNYKVYKLYQDDKVYGIFIVNDELLFTKEYDLNGSKKVVINFNLNDAEEINMNHSNIRRR